MPQKNPAAWKIAAAILYSENTPTHYISLTKRVLELGLSEFGKNAQTPELTLNKFLNQKPDYFERVGKGTFLLKDAKRKDAEIRTLSLSLENDLLNSIEKDLESKKYENQLSEGEKLKRLSSFHERNPKLREQAIRIHGTKCMVFECGFDFEGMYGKHGTSFIEVHHLIPISSFDKDRIVDPETELVVVCSNCHRMIHRNKNNPLTLNQVSELIRNNHNT